MLGLYLFNCRRWDYTQAGNSLIFDYAHITLQPTYIIFIQVIFRFNLITCTSLMHILSLCLICARYACTNIYFFMFGASTIKKDAHQLMNVFCFLFCIFYFCLTGIQISQQYLSSCVPFGYLAGSSYISTQYPAANSYSLRAGSHSEKTF